MMDGRADGCLSDGMSDTLFMGPFVCGAIIKQYPCFIKPTQHPSTSAQSKSFPFCTALAIARGDYDDDMMDGRTDGWLSDAVSDTLFTGLIVCGAVIAHKVSLFYQTYKASLHLCPK